MLTGYTLENLETTKSKAQGPQKNSINNNIIIETAPGNSNRNSTEWKLKREAWRLMLLELSFVWLRFILSLLLSFNYQIALFGFSEDSFRDWVCLWAFEFGSGPQFSNLVFVLEPRRPDFVFNFWAVSLFVARIRAGQVWEWAFLLRFLNELSDLFFYNRFGGIELFFWTLELCF